MYQIPGLLRILRVTTRGFSGCIITDIGTYGWEMLDYLEFRVSVASRE